MCGLFGFIGTRMDIGLVSTLAALAETRGPHAYGFAWLDTGGALHVHKAPGRITQHQHDLLKLLDAPAGIGHCRLSTSGAAADNANNQPLRMGDIALAHNGNVYHSAQIFTTHGYAPRTACDSEALLLEIYVTFGTLAERVAQGRQALGAREPHALLVLGREGIVAGRAYHPLYVTPTPGGVYFCSRPHADAAQLLPDGAIQSFSLQG